MMTEIDYLKHKINDMEKAFDKLHQRHMVLLKEQGELERYSNEQQSKIKELEKKNKELKIKYTNRGIAITKAVEDLYRKEEVYLADFDICKRITEYEWEFNNE